MAELWDLRPDLTVISGDLVEHATGEEFEGARKWIDRLPLPRLIVPGNHDLPFYDPIRRLRLGLRSFRRFIDQNPEPLYLDSEMAVVGISTPRKIPHKGGRISGEQLAHVQKHVCGLDDEIVRILVTHHPLDLPARFHKNHLVGRASNVVKNVSDCVDLLIAGHIHLSSAGATAARYKGHKRSAIFAQAGTLLSKRNKGEPNSYNVIRITSSEIGIQHRAWDDRSKRYQECQWETFEHVATGWSKVEGGGRTTVELE